MGIAIPQVVTEDRASGAQVIDGSLKFNDDSSNYLKRIPSSVGNQKTWTWSSWVKRSTLGGSQRDIAAAALSNNYLRIAGFTSGDNLEVCRADSAAIKLQTNQVFRDISAWYHIVVAFDTTNGTSGDRIKLYVNGTRVTSLSTASYPSQNAEYAVNAAYEMRIGAFKDKTSATVYSPFDGEISQCYLIDGQQLGPESFGYTDSLTNTWRPKKYTGSFNTPGSGLGGVTWSSFVSGPVESSYPLSKCFSGTIGSGYNNGTRPTVGNTLTLNIASLNLNVTNVRLNSYLAVSLGSPSTFTVNGSTVTTNIANGNQTHVIAVNGQLNTIAWSYDNGNGPYVYMRGIEVDLDDGAGYRLLTDGAGAAAGVNGFYLPMDGNSPIGHDLSNPNPVNNGTTWSSKHSGTVYGGSVANVFDDDLTNRAEINNSDSNNNHFTVSSISVKASKIGVYVSNAGTDVEVSINGSAVGTIASGSITSSSQLFSFTFTETTITSVKVRRVGSTSGWYLYGISVDGVVLIDGIYGNGWTPVNFGGSVALPKATGAKPILNTLPGGKTATPGVFGSKENLFYTVTTANGSVYQFDITSGDNPSLSFIRGATYRFDYTSHSSHPLRFSSTNPDSSTSAYTDGTNTSVSNVITITVPHNAPDTLYYYCTAHASGMNGSISVTTDETKADLHAWKSVLALPLVGSKDDVSNSVNSGSTTKVITATNSVASSAVSNFYGGSWYFDGSGDTLTVPNNTDFNFGSGDSTIEMWIYPTRISGTQENIMTRGTSGYSGFIMSVTNFLDTVNGSSWGVNITYDNPLIANAWQHIAVCRSGNTWTVYINGIANGSATASGSVQASAHTLTIGQRTGQTDFQGYMSDIHIYKGAAKYTSNFIPASTNPDILPDTPSGVSGGSKLTKVTDGAVSFDGTGDYLLSGASSDNSLGTGNFTIEGYIYPNSASGTQGIMGIGNATTDSIQIFYNVSNSQKVRFNVTNRSFIESTGTAPAKSWSHFAVVREGTGSNETKIYINGKLEAQGTISNNLAETILQIGRPNTSSGTEYFNGVVSNFRVIKGTALYTSNFTPPFRTLTNVTNTKLLCCQSNTSATAAAVTPGTITIPNPGYEFSTAKSYSVYSDAARGANYTVQYSANNSDWTTAWTGVMTANSECGIINGTGGGSSYGRHNYWRYVEGSATQGHHPRVSRIILTTTGGTDVNIKVYTSDNCSDSGTYQVNTVTYTDGTYGTQTNQTAPTNFNPFTTDINAVRGQETGYNILNPLAKANITLSNGNLDLTHSGSNGNWQLVLSTIGMSSGKFYCEFLCQDADSVIGIAKGTHVIANDKYVGNDPNGWGYNGQNGQKLNNSSGSSYGSSYTAGDVIGIAFDADNGTLSFYKNNIDQGQAFSGLTDEYHFAFSIRDTGYTHSVNFGQKPFKFPPPEGFQSVNAANVKPIKVITHPDHYVAATIYTGDGGASKSISGLNFGGKPDLVWVKGRSYSISHLLYDSVRGAGSTKSLVSNGTNTEGSAGDNATFGYVSSLDNNGFSLVGGSDVNNGYVNKNTATYVGWCWKAGGNKNTFNVDDVGYASAAAVGMNVGGQNSNAYDQSKTWSTSATITGSPDSASYSYSNVFDGTPYAGATAQADNSQTPYVYKPNTAISGNTIRIRIAYYGNPNDNFFQVNNVSYGNNVKAAMSASTETWFTLPIQTINTTNGISLKADGTNSFNLAGIEVDGKLLVDQGLTPANAPSIAATGCSVGTKQGFSIVTYNGSGSNGTFGHGLLETPNLIIVKCRNVAQNWAVQHSAYGPTKYTYLNSTNEARTTGAAAFWNNIAPTNSTVSVGTDNDTNASGKTYVAYCWHDVPGLQKFGIYEGNNNADGPFVELGFRPAIIWMKNIDSTGPWNIYDNKRDTFNGATKILLANTSGGGNANDAFVGSYPTDFLSNGFKIRNTTGEINAANTFIYCAWAEAPEFNLFGAQSNAR